MERSSAAIEIDILEFLFWALLEAASVETIDQLHETESALEMSGSNVITASVGETEPAQRAFVWWIHDNSRTKFALEKWFVETQKQDFPSSSVCALAGSL